MEFNHHHHHNEFHGAAAAAAAPTMDSRSNSNSSTLRRDVIRACKARGWTVQPNALQAMVVACQRVPLSEILDAVSENMRERGKQQQQHRAITESMWNQVVEKQQQQQQKINKPSKERVQFIDAFATPKLKYDVMRKQFSVEMDHWPLFGTAEDKINMLSQRYALIQQRILRHELFRRTDILRNQLQHKLTPIESLLGQKAQRQNGDSILLLGILLEIEQGRYYLEDFTGQVPVSFRDATVTEGWYVTPHSIVLAEGIFVDGLFYILRMGQPLPERRHDSLQAIRQHVAHPDYALPSSRPHAVGGSHHLSDQSFVVLSEVHLDQPKVQQQLEALLAMYEKCNTDRFPTFILMGNFSSAWTTTVPSSSTSMDELLNMIAKFPSLSEHGRFCIVPGPRDGTASPVLPFPAIRGNHRPKIAGAAARPMSNPCRIRFQQNHPNPGGEGNSTNNYDIIVFRYNLLRIFQQHSLSLPTSSSTKENNDIDANDDDDKRLLRSPHCRLVKTVLDQGHLIPVAGAVPVYWNYDHALSLYPLPNVLILADDDIEEPFHERYEGCDVIHPGSFAKDGSYAIYHNDCRRYDDDDDVEDFDTSLENGPVEFLRLGG